MIVEINLVEAASELAHNRTLFESGDILSNEDEMYKDIDSDVLEYKEEVQDRFNGWYDYYYALLESFVINKSEEDAEVQ